MSRIPFGLMAAIAAGGGGGGFDPTTLAWSSYYRASYGGAPWSPTASAGGSGTAGNLVAGDAPSVGTAVDGLTPADWNGTSDVLFNSTTPQSTLFSTTAGGILCAFYARTAAAPGADYADPAFFRNLGGDQGLTFSTSGVKIFVSSGGYQTRTLAAAPGAWHVALGRWNGSALDLLVDAASDSVGCGALTIGGGDGVVGSGYGGGFLDGLILEVGTFAYRPSDADFANYKSYLHATYPSAF